MEAIYHKAVIVGIPLRYWIENEQTSISSLIHLFSNDQKPNLLRAERHGYAVSLDWDEMTGLKSEFYIL